MKPDSILKEIVKAVKSKEELKGVRCVYSHNREFAQNPVCAFTLCLGVGKSRFEKNPDSSNPQYSTEFNLCLLAPNGAGGKRLSEMALWISEAIRESLDVNLVEVGSSQFNSTDSALFTDIKVVVEDTSLADTVCDLYIDGAFAEGLLLFEIESSERLIKEGSLLAGYSFTDSGSKEYSIMLKTSKLLNVKSEGFVLKLEYDDFYEEYEGCRINKITRNLSQWGSLSFTYDIKAQSMKLCEKEVQDE